MTAYLDSSAVLRYILNEPGCYKRWHAFDALVSSRVMRAECKRTLLRARENQKFTDQVLLELINSLDSFLRKVSLIPISEELLNRVELPFILPLATLDAIHLATAEAVRQRIGPGMAFITHDLSLARAAGAHGFSVIV